MPHVPQPAGVLVVEDNAGIRRMLAAFFAQQSIPFWSAACGQEAVAVFSQHRASIAIVLCDVQMPDWDGPKTVDELRKIDSSIPFCFMTGDGGGYAINDLLALGATRVFRKPFESLSSLARFLREFLAEEN